MVEIENFIFGVLAIITLCVFIYVRKQDSYDRKRYIKIQRDQSENYILLQNKYYDLKAEYELYKGNRSGSIEQYQQQYEQLKESYSDLRVYEALSKYYERGCEIRKLDHRDILFNDDLANLENQGFKRAPIGDCYDPLNRYPSNIVILYKSPDSNT